MSERGKKEKVLKRISRKIVAYSHTLAHSPILLHTHTHRGIYSLPLFTLTHTHSRQHLRTHTHTPTITRSLTLTLALTHTHPKNSQSQSFTAYPSTDEKYHVALSTTRAINQILMPSAFQQKHFFMLELYQDQDLKIFGLKDLWFKPICSLRQGAQEVLIILPTHSIRTDYKRH